MRVFLFLLAFVSVVFGHDGHVLLLEEVQGRPTNWLEWVGSFHLILLHFPIALITMTVFAEFLYYVSQRLIFDYAARFMLIIAAILTLPTAIFGLIFSFSRDYTGTMAVLLALHQWFGVTTAVLAIITAFVREREGRTNLYFILLGILFLLVLITAYFGGAMVWGPGQFLPPT